MGNFFFNAIVCKCSIQEKKTFRFQFEHFWTLFTTFWKKRKKSIKSSPWILFKMNIMVKYLFAVFLTLLFAYKIRDWIANNNEFMKISCDVITFLFSEIATWILLYVHLDMKVMDKGYFKTFNAYFYMCILLLPVLNSLIHSVLIYHLIRGVSETDFSLFWILLHVIDKR